MKLAYHCSPVGEIEVFEPDKSKGIKVVYATPYKPLAYDFGVEGHNDYMVHPIIDPKSGSMRLVEMAPDALDKHYKNKSAYLYTFNAEEFTVPMRWAGEIASDKPVKPLSVTFVPDLKAAIMAEKEKGNLELLSFAERNKYGNMDRFFGVRALVGGARDKAGFQRHIAYLHRLENKEIYRQAKEILDGVAGAFQDKTPLAEKEKPVALRRFLRGYDGKADAETCAGFMCELFWEAEIRPDDVAKIIKEMRNAGNEQLIETAEEKCRRMQKLLPENDLTKDLLLAGKKRNGR